MDGFNTLEYFLLLIHSGHLIYGYQFISMSIEIQIRIT